MRKGLTLVEMLLVMSMMAILFIGGMVFSRNFLSSGNFSTSVLEIKNAMLTAQNRALVNFGGEDSGVNFESDSFTLFTDDTYDIDNTANLAVEVPETVTIENIDFDSGSTLYFEQSTGVPIESGSLEVQSVMGQSATINVDANGVISITYD